MKKIKQILSMLLVVCCVVTMIPSTVFANFETNSGTTTDVGGSSGNKLVNLVNVGYRISLYYAGRESNNKRYMAPIAYNESGNKPMMMKFSSMFDSEDYNDSKSKSDKVSATYFRDLAATKASILVLNKEENNT
ncbi:MAG: hypothetical protein MR589_07750 [Lachnobacterium sp.]|nr:hypothetical protein [Lachnobacterium sp.]